MLRIVTDKLSSGPYAFLKVEKPGTLFRFKGLVCMSSGWPSGQNDVHFVYLEGPRVGQRDSRHNGCVEVEALLVGELTVRER